MYLRVTSKSVLHLDNCTVSLKKAITLGYGEAEAYSVLGNAYLKQNMLEEAIVAYKSALQLDPSLRGARNNLRTAEERLRARQ